MENSLLADDIILYVENPKESTKQLSELINVFSKVVGYINKINIQKSVVLLQNKQYRITLLCTWN